MRLSGAGFATAFLLGSSLLFLLAWAYYAEPWYDGPVTRTILNSTAKDNVGSAIEYVR